MHLRQSISKGENNRDLLLLGQAALDMKMLPRAKPFPSNMLDVSLANSKIIKDRSGRHTLPASLFGVGMSKLKHRVADVLHQYQLENESWHLVKNMVGNRFCMTTGWNIKTI